MILCPLVRWTGALPIRIGIPHHPTPRTASDHPLATMTTSTAATLRRCHSQLTHSTRPRNLGFRSYDSAIDSSCNRASLLVHSHQPCPSPRLVALQGQRRAERWFPYTSRWRALVGCHGGSCTSALRLHDASSSSCRVASVLHRPRQRPHRSSLCAREYLPWYRRHQERVARHSNCPLSGPRTGT